MNLTPDIIAGFVKGKVEGNGELPITGFAKIEEAKAGDITFIANPKYAHFIHTSSASSVLVSDGFETEGSVKPTLIRVPDPYVALAALLNAVEARKPRKHGVEQPCHIAGGVEVPDDVYIGAFAYIGEGVTLGKGVMIYPQAYIGDGVHIGDDTVILGLSGGVDSSVAAMLLHKAIGSNLHCIFVDSGLLRKDEFAEVMESYKDMGLNVRGVNAADRFFADLKGVTDPEQKRKIIGRDFVEVFNAEAKKIGGAKWLAQGTIYPDVIESCSVKGPSATIKSHHNVGGLPKEMNLKIVEPLRLLFKDEVRRVGRELKMPQHLLGRHPFPGPGLGIRVLGEVTPEKVDILQQADRIFIDGLRREGLYDKVWQAGTILLPGRSVGGMGDARTYENTVALRAVISTDGMTADWVHLPYEFLAQVSNDIINHVRGVNRVVYDISSKPPATIEWE